MKNISEYHLPLSLFNKKPPIEAVFLYQIYGKYASQNTVVLVR